MSAVRDLKHLLVTREVCDATQVFIDYLPDTPDICISIRGYGGPAPEFTHDSGDAPAYEFPYFQVTVRGEPAAENVHAMTELLAEAAYSALFAQNLSLNGTWYRRIVPQQTPFFFARDDRQRNQFKFNVRVERAPQKTA